MKNYLTIIKADDLHLDDRVILTSYFYTLKEAEIELSTKIKNLRTTCKYTNVKGVIFDLNKMIFVSK